LPLLRCRPARTPNVARTGKKEKRTQLVFSSGFTDPTKELYANLYGGPGSILHYHHLHPDEPIDLYGYSRGGATAVILANYLGFLGVPVRFLGIVEPSVTWSGLPPDLVDLAHSIPPNVNSAFVGYGTGKDGGIKDFKNGRIETIQVLPEGVWRGGPSLTDFSSATAPVGHIGAADNATLKNSLKTAAKKCGVPLP
jgi:hypothetical protein